MRPLYDRDGRVAAFLRGDRIVSIRGDSVGWISDGRVYDYAGQHLGWWDTTHMRGPDGGVVVWLKGAENLGIMLPIPLVSPMSPADSLEPVRPTPSSTPPRPPDKGQWSVYVLGR